MSVIVEYVIAKNCCNNADGDKLKFSEKRVSEGDFIRQSSHIDRLGFESALPW